MPEARQAPRFELDLWKQWEGQSVDSEFLLERCSGGSSRGAVFETQFQGRPAAIKLIPGTRELVDGLLATWKKTASLSHPALVQMLAHGETALGDTLCAYTVMEHAEENLAEVLAERKLTPAETRETLLPVLSALQYLEAQGFSHGRLQPANVLAFGDQVKISSDGLVVARDSTTDCRALGALIREAMPAQLPEPYVEIVNGCLTPDPAARWNLVRIDQCLRALDLSKPSRPKSRFIGWGLAAAAVATLAMFALWPMRESMPRNVAPPVLPGNVVPAPPAVDPRIADQTKPSAAVNLQAKPPETRPLEAKSRGEADVKEAKPPKTGAALKATAEATATETATVPPDADGITQVLPDISRQALGTITGRVRINVGIHVDSAGAVSQATLQSPAASKYFIDRVLAAAQAWKFPAGKEGDWVLHFELVRTQMRVTPQRIGN